MPRNMQQRRFSIAPMMDWTDRHCRFFHRLLTRRALLYTEMVTTDAVIHGDRARLLGFDPAEHPVALQLGGSDPAALARGGAHRRRFRLSTRSISMSAVRPTACRTGTFGACLMAEPALVGDCVAAMKAAVTIPVTVKCRIGVDEQDPEAALDALARDGRCGRRRCAVGACAQGLARRTVAQGEPRHPAARLRPRLPAEGARIRTSTDHQWRHSARRGCARASRRTSMA